MSCEEEDNGLACPGSCNATNGSSSTATMSPSNPTFLRCVVGKAKWADYFRYERLSDYLRIPHGVEIKWGNVPGNRPYDDDMGPLVRSFSSSDFLDPVSNTSASSDKHNMPSRRQCTGECACNTGGEFPTKSDQSGQGKYVCDYEPPKSVAGNPGSVTDGETKKVKRKDNNLFVSCKIPKAYRPAQSAHAFGYPPPNIETEDFGPYDSQKRQFAEPVHLFGYPQTSVEAEYESNLNPQARQNVQSTHAFDCHATHAISAHEGSYFAFACRPPLSAQTFDHPGLDDDASGKRKYSPQRLRSMQEAQRFYSPPFDCGKRQYSPQRLRFVRDSQRFDSLPSNDKISKYMPQWLNSIHDAQRPDNPPLDDDDERKYLPQRLQSMQDTQNFDSSPLDDDNERKYLTQRLRSMQDAQRFDSSPLDDEDERKYLSQRLQSMQDTQRFDSSPLDDDDERKYLSQRLRSLQDTQIFDSPPLVERQRPDSDQFYRNSQNDKVLPVYMASNGQGRKEVPELSPYTVRETNARHMQIRQLDNVNCEVNVAPKLTKQLPYDPLKTTQNTNIWVGQYQPSVHRFATEELDQNREETMRRHPWTTIQSYNVRERPTQDNHQHSKTTLPSHISSGNQMPGKEAIMQPPIVKSTNQLPTVYHHTTGDQHPHRQPKNRQVPVDKSLKQQVLQKCDQSHHISINHPSIYGQSSVVQSSFEESVNCSMTIGRTSDQQQLSTNLAEKLPKSQNQTLIYPLRTVEHEQFGNEPTTHSVARECSNNCDGDVGRQDARHPTDASQNPNRGHEVWRAPSAFGQYEGMSPTEEMWITHFLQTLLPLTRFPSHPSKEDTRPVENLSQRLLTLIEEIKNRLELSNDEQAAEPNASTLDNDKVNSQTRQILGPQSSENVKLKTKAINGQSFETQGSYNLHPNIYEKHGNTNTTNRKYKSSNYIQDKSLIPEKIDSRQFSPSSRKSDSTVAILSSLEFGGDVRKSVATFVEKTASPANITYDNTTSGCKALTGSPSSAAQIIPRKDSLMSDDNGNNENLVNVHNEPVSKTSYSHNNDIKVTNVKPTIKVLTKPRKSLSTTSDTSSTTCTEPSDGENGVLPKLTVCMHQSRNLLSPRSKSPDIAVKRTERRYNKKYSCCDTCNPRKILDENHRHTKPYSLSFSERSSNKSPNVSSADTDLTVSKEMYSEHSQSAITFDNPKLESDDVSRKNTTVHEDALVSPSQQSIGTLCTKESIVSPVKEIKPQIGTTYSANNYIIARPITFTSSFNEHSMGPKVSSGKPLPPPHNNTEPTRLFENYQKDVSRYQKPDAEFNDNISVIKEASFVKDFSSLKNSASQMKSFLEFHQLKEKDDLIRSSPITVAYASQHVIPFGDGRRVSQASYLNVIAEESQVVQENSTDDADLDDRIASIFDNGNCSSIHALQSRLQQMENQIKDIEKLFINERITSVRNIRKIHEDDVHLNDYIMPPDISFNIHDDKTRPKTIPGKQQVKNKEQPFANNIEHVCEYFSSLNISISNWDLHIQDSSGILLHQSCLGLKSGAKRKLADDGCETRGKKCITKQDLSNFLDAVMVQSEDGRIGNVPTVLSDSCWSREAINAPFSQVNMVNRTPSTKRLQFNSPGLKKCISNESKQTDSQPSKIDGYDMQIYSVYSVLRTGMPHSQRQTSQPGKCMITITVKPTYYVENIRKYDIEDAEKKKLCNEIVSLGIEELKIFDIGTINMPLLSMMNQNRKFRESSSDENNTESEHEYNEIRYATARDQAKIIWQLEKQRIELQDMKRLLCECLARLDMEVAYKNSGALVSRWTPQHESCGTAEWNISPLSNSPSITCLKIIDAESKFKHLQHRERMYEAAYPECIHDRNEYDLSRFLSKRIRRLPTSHLSYGKCKKSTLCYKPNQSKDSDKRKSAVGEMFQRNRLLRRYVQFFSRKEKENEKTGQNENPHRINSVNGSAIKRMISYILPRKCSRQGRRYESQAFIKLFENSHLQSNSPSVMGILDTKEKSVTPTIGPFQTIVESDTLFKVDRVSASHEESIINTSSKSKFRFRTMRNSFNCYFRSRYMAKYCDRCFSWLHKPKRPRTHKKSHTFSSDAQSDVRNPRASMEKVSTEVNCWSFEESDSSKEVLSQPVLTHCWGTAQSHKSPLPKSGRYSDAKAIQTEWSKEPLGERGRRTPLTTIPEVFHQSYKINFNDTDPSSLARPSCTGELNMFEIEPKLLIKVFTLNKPKRSEPLRHQRKNPDSLEQVASSSHQSIQAEGQISYVDEHLLPIRDRPNLSTKVCTAHSGERMPSSCCLFKSMSAGSKADDEALDESKRDSGNLQAKKDFQASLQRKKIFAAQFDGLIRNKRSKHSQEILPNGVSLFKCPLAAFKTCENDKTEETTRDSASLQTKEDYDAFCRRKNNARFACLNKKDRMNHWGKRLQTMRSLFKLSSVTTMTRENEDSEETSINCSAKYLETVGQNNVRLKIKHSFSEQFGGLLDQDDTQHSTERFQIRRSLFQQPTASSSTGDIDDAGEKTRRDLDYPQVKTALKRFRVLFTTSSVSDQHKMGQNTTTLSKKQVDSEVALSEVSFHSQQNDIDPTHRSNSITEAVCGSYTLQDDACEFTLPEYEETFPRTRTASGKVRFEPNLSWLSLSTDSDKSEGSSSPKLKTDQGENSEDVGEQSSICKVCRHYLCGCFIHKFVA